VSDPRRQDLDSIDVDSIGRAPPGLHERGDDWAPSHLGRAKDRPDRSAQRKSYEVVAHLRPVEDREQRGQKPPDIFAEAVAKAMQEQLEPELVEAPSVLKTRHRFGIAARFAVAAGAAALIALGFVVVFPVSQGPAEEGASSALPTWQSLKSSLFAAPQRKHAPMLAVRDGSGAGSAVGMSASADAVPSGPATPQPQQLMVSPAVPPAAAPAESPAREISPDEVAGFVKRAQDLLVTGDLQAARLLLLRAAEAHDARAALTLAKTFDPIVSKQFGAADLEPDLAQARHWYQKADEWGAPDAQRQLDALASYTR